jgi:hypothetical protein
MKITCYLQANSNRQQFLKQTIESLNNQTIFSEKMILVFGTQNLLADIKELLESTNWIIEYQNTTRLESFKYAVNKLDADFIFYTEDDIEHMQLPEKIVEYLVPECGLLSLNLGGSTCDYPHSLGDLRIGLDYVFDLFGEDQEYCVHKRDLEKRNNYFFEFPCLFMNKTLLNKMIPFMYPTNDIERVLTNIYLNFPEYYKLSICKSEFIDQLNWWKDIPDFPYRMEKAKLYRILDPKQGGVDWNLELLK